MHSQASPEGLMEAVVCSASDITSSPTGKCAHFTWSLHCLTWTGSLTRGVPYLQIHLLRPGQATSVKDSPTLSTRPLNLNHLCQSYVFIWPSFPAMRNFLKTTAFPSHENGTVVIKRLKTVRMFILFMLVHQHRTFGIELKAKNRKKEFPQSIFVQNTDNRVKKISSCSSRFVKPDLIPQSEMQTDASCPVTLRLIRQDLSGMWLFKVSCFAWGAFNPSFTSHSSTFRC